MGASINWGGIDSAAGLDQDVMPFVAELRDQGEGFGLRERFSACDFHQPAVVGVHLRQNLFDGLLIPAEEGRLCIEPGAA